MPIPTLQTHPNLLTPSECQAFISLAESSGYLAMKGDYPPSYRGNDRIVIDDPGLSKRMFARLRSSLPTQLDFGGQAWELNGLNSRFRGCRYTNGQHFTRHKDGAHNQPDGSRSFHTLMLYLNDQAEFRGGHTRFYADRWSARPTRSIPPCTGMGIIFDHSLWHDGQSVTDGVKYVLRTDVMYRPTNRVPEGHSGYVWCLAALPDGRIASGSRDKTVRVWSEGKQTQVLRYHQASVTCLLTRHKQLWSGSRDRDVAIWRCSDGSFKLQRSFRAHEGAVLSMERLANGHVITTGADNSARTWNAEGYPIKKLATTSWPWASCQAPDGSIFVACDDGNILHSDLKDEHLKPWKKTPTGALSLTVGVGGEILAGCADGRIRRWQGYGYPLADWVGHQGPVTSLETLPDGRILSASEDDAVRIWNDGESAEIVQHADFVRAVCPTADGRNVVTASYDGSVLWTSLPREINPAAIAFTERAANPGGAISGTAVAT